MGLTACSSGGSTEDGSSSADGGANNAAGSGGGTASGSSTSSGGTPSNTGGAGAAGSGSSSGTGGNATQNGGAQVITWVPPYRVNESKQMLEAQFGSLTAADGISQLALQFWITDGGSLKLEAVSEADITWFHDWAREHGVQILLCVHNHVGGDWNWPEAQRSFKDNGPEFTASLLSEIAKRDFDGVNLDLEGIVDATVDDETAYLKLVQDLATALHPLGKVVTVDSFHGQWNAPNWNWWPELLPIVDGITSMGYDQSGLDVDYETLTERSMPYPEKLTLGVPSYEDTWQGHTVTEQLAWIVDQGQIGVGIWDASFGTAGWQTEGVWTQLSTIKAR